MEAASELDVTLIASASLLQGQVAKNLPGLLRRRWGCGTTRSARCSLCGRRRELLLRLWHVARGTRQGKRSISGLPPATVDEFSKLFSRGEGA